MDNLDQEILDLEKKLQEAKQKKLEQPTIVKINTFVKSSGKIHIQLSKFDEHLVEVLRRCPSRIYSGDDNIINAIDLDSVLDRFKSNPKPYEIIWQEKAQKEYDEWIKQPDMKLVLNEKKSTVEIELGPKLVNQRLYLSSDIQTLDYNVISRSYSFALAEAYKFPKIVEAYYPHNTVEYDEKVKEAIINQTEKKEKLLSIANAGDAPEIQNPFSGVDATTGERYDLKPHQRVAVKFAQLTDFKSLIAYDMGGGKTPIGIAAAEIGLFKKVLIICPAPLKTNWRKEIKKFVEKEALILSGSHPEDWQIDDIIQGNHQYYIINYDIMSRSELSEENDGKEESVNKWTMVINLASFDLFIVDESHRIKNMDSKRSKAVRAINMPHVLPLSGTPIVNRPGELFPTLNIIDKKNFGNHGAFSSQFMYSDGSPKNVKQLHEILSQYMIRRTWEQIYGKDLNPNRIPFTKELSGQARANYQKVLEGIYISLRRPDYQRNVTSILAELTRCKQISSADNIEASADLAIEALEETGKKVIIFSQYLESQAEIRKLIGAPAHLMNGSTPDDARYELMEKFQDPNSDVRVIITNILEGITLTAAWTVIFNDLWWTPKDHRQAEGRAFGRTNDPHSGNAYYIQNENTIDEMIVELLARKLATFKEVIDGVPQAQQMEKSVVSELLDHLRKSL